MKREVECTCSGSDTGEPHCPIHGFSRAIDVHVGGGSSEPPRSAPAQAENAADVNASLEPDVAANLRRLESDPDGVDGLRLRLAEAQADRDEGWRRKREVGRQLDALRDAVKPILASYRTQPVHITQEQITAAWEAFDA